MNFMIFLQIPVVGWGIPLHHATITSIPATIIFYLNPCTVYCRLMRDVISSVLIFTTET